MAAAAPLHALSPPFFFFFRHDLFFYSHSSLFGTLGKKNSRPHAVSICFLLSGGDLFLERRAFKNYFPDYYFFFWSEQKSVEDSNTFMVLTIPSVVFVVLFSWGFLLLIAFCTRIPQKSRQLLLLTLHFFSLFQNKIVPIRVTFAKPPKGGGRGVAYLWRAIANLG